MGNSLFTHLNLIRILFLFLLVPSFECASNSLENFKSASEIYYQNLEGSTLSLAEKHQQWEVLYTKLEPSKFFNLKALTLYQLSNSSVRLKNEQSFLRWFDVLRQLNLDKQDPVIAYLSDKLQLERYFAKNEYHRAIQIGTQLLNARQFLVIDRQPVRYRGALTLPLTEFSHTINTLGKAHYLVGQYEQSQKLFLQSLAGFEELGDDRNVSKILNNLSVIAWTQKDIEKALVYLERGLVLSKVLNDTRSIISKLSNKGVYLNALDRLQSAEETFILTLEHPRIGEFPLLDINTRLALSEVYSKQKKYDKSETLILSALDLSEKTGLDYSQFNAVTVLAGLRNSTKNYSEAITLYQSALRYYTKKDLKKHVSTVLMNLSESYRLTGQSVEALDYYVRYHEIEDELKKNVHQKNLTELQAKYDSRERIKQIDLLQKENALRKQELTSANIQRYNIITYGVVSFVIVLLFFSRYNSLKESKRLRKYNQQIETREKQLLLLSHAFKSTSDGVWITDKEFVIEVVNEAFTKLTGWTNSIGQKKIFSSSQGNDQGLTDKILLQVKSEGVWQGEVYDQRASGEIYPIELKIELIMNKQGEIIHYLGAFRDISKRKQAEEKIIQNATQDSLTGLPNRVLFRELIQRSLVAAKKKHIIPAIFFIDVDGFKKLNDSLGHEAGDRFICAIAERLAESVGSNNVIARLGGDEFGLLVELAGKKTEAGSIAKKVLKAFNRPIVQDDRSIKITVSVGVSLYNPALITKEGGDSNFQVAEDLIHNADIAMNFVKQNGKNAFHFFESHMNDEVFETLDLEQRLVNAIDNQYFEFYYQPIVDIKKQSIVGAEALIRCVEPEGNILQPDQFIPLAEKLGLIEEIDAIVIDRVFSQVSEWQNSTFVIRHISINLSAKIFANADFLIRLLEEKLKAYKISAALIKIEITEGMLVSNFETVISTMHRLKSLGFTLAIDDFGTGFSSLNYLKQFPVDVLKIDRTFIFDMHDSDKNKSIVKSIIDLAHNLGFSVIAEGVEEAEHANQLSVMGCEEYQGYYFSKPLPVPEFESLVKQ